MKLSIMTIEISLRPKLSLLVSLALMFFTSMSVANDCVTLGSKIKGQAKMSEVEITAATDYSDNESWSAPPTARMLPAIKLDKAFCRVEGVIEKEIQFELWLPPKAVWNGRYLGVGNGGEAGWINYNELQRGLNRNFASASTDTGHRQEDTHWALGNPQRVENFGHRAHHLLAETAKQIIELYYSEKHRHAYFIGCSGGGLQGLNEVQRYPADYDGIISGAAGYSMVPLSARFILSGLLEQQNHAGNLTSEQWKKVADNAVEYCDVKDGINDGFVSDPRACDFNLDSIDYLTKDQIERVKTLYGALVDETGRELFPGFYPGIQFIPQARQMDVAGRSFGEWLYQDPDWTPQDFQLGRDLKIAEASLPGLRASNPDLEPFYRLGGKLISYMGWDDPTVPAQASIDYYDSVRQHIGDKTDDFYRFFLAPGMGHCRRGAGPDQFGQAFTGDAPTVDAEHDMLSAMVRWVEEGVAPNRIIASRLKDGEVDMTRPLCSYPQQAHYKGIGETDRAENFECR